MLLLCVILSILQADRLLLGVILKLGPATVFKYAGWLAVAILNGFDAPVITFSSNIACI